MSSNDRPIRISVIGGSQATRNMREVAAETGELIAKRDALLVCGGLGGVMEAACRGAKRADGTTIGIVPTRQAADANPYVDIPIVTGMGDARNVSVALTGMGIIAIDGGFGTLSEMALGLNAKRPLATINAPAEQEFTGLDQVRFCDGADRAVEWVFDQISEADGS